MNIAIVTDSTADIPEDLLRKFQIHVVPNIIVLEGKSFQDGIGISREAFYEKLPSMQELPTTATASSAAYEQLYQQLFQNGAQHVLSIHASSLLSGIYNAAGAAARAFEPRVQVVDSGQVTLGLGFQVLAAAEAAVQGSSLETLLDIVEDVGQRVRLVAMLDTLEYIRRSGRVSWARARLGNLLRLKPFVRLEQGQVLSLGEARTRLKGIARLKEFLVKLGSFDRLAILHTNAEQDARQFLEDLPPEIDLSRLPQPPLIVNVTTIIGTHVGPNGLGFVAVLNSLVK